MELVVLGKITKIRGVNGEFKVLSSTFFGKKRYKKGNKIYIGSDENSLRELTVKAHHTIDKFDYVTTEEILTTTEAEKYIDMNVYAAKDDIHLDKDEYFFGDLEKCDVYDEEGNRLGHVTNVEEFPAQITLNVEKENKETFYVPFVDEFIKNVDIENKSIIIHVIEGLL
ncbi:MAG: ribosome maturation factor RimM [Coprobacillus sp.]|nr:ribosome maturation factor RimM [Coprobacillus sp.]